MIGTIVNIDSTNHIVELIHVDHTHHIRVVEHREINGVDQGTLGIIQSNVNNKPVAHFHFFVRSDQIEAYRRIGGNRPQVNIF